MASKSIINQLDMRIPLIRKVYSQGLSTLYNFIDQSPYLSLFLIIFGVVLSPVAVLVVASSLVLALIAFSSGLAGGMIFAPILIVTIVFATTAWMATSALVGIYRGLSDAHRARLFSLFNLSAETVPASNLPISDEAYKPVPESVRELRDRFSAYASTLPDLKKISVKLEEAMPEPLTTAHYHELAKLDDFEDEPSHGYLAKQASGFKVSFSPKVVSHLPIDHPASQIEIKEEGVVNQESSG